MCFPMLAFVCCLDLLWVAPNGARAGARPGTAVVDSRAQLPPLRLWLP